MSSIMLYISVLFFVFSCWSRVASAASQDEHFAYKWEEKWFNDMPIDHFSFTDNRTFSIRYLENNENWHGNASGPIFVYLGNEMRIESFANNSGFMWDLAPEFGASLLFIEHRYYGKTLPFGDKSFEGVHNLGYLTAMQALADFAQFITTYKKNTPGASHSPVIAFGGSYGAMLAAWMRIKYPHVVTGAYVASGPILQFLGQAPCDNYARITTRTFKNSGPNCDQFIKSAWPAARRLAKTPEGRDWLNNKFALCGADKMRKEEDVSAFIDLVSGAFGNLAMLDYPYDTNFVKPLPAYPAKASCACFAGHSLGESDEGLLAGLQCSINVYFNHSGNTQCLSGAADDETFGAWPFQCCADLLLPNCRTGVNDMFEPSAFDLTEYSDNCAKQYNVRPKPYWPEINYGGRHLEWATNIMFSNGDLDPWSAGSVTEAYPGMHPSVHVIYIKNAAHHLDLRAEHPLDPVYVRQARQQQRLILRKWVQYKY